MKLILSIIVDGLLLLWFLGLFTYFNIKIFEVVLWLSMRIFTKPFRKKSFDSFYSDFETHLLVRRKKLWVFYTEYFPWVVILMCFAFAFWLVNWMGFFPRFISHFS